MKIVVVQFPGSNRDKDVITALGKIAGKKIKVIWHEQEIPKGTDLVVLPGGFSYGDYLRCGAIAARAKAVESIRNSIGNSIRNTAKKGTRVLGICNGFQILCEAGLLPGALMYNKSLNFVCKEVKLEIVNNESPFTQLYEKGEIIRCPVAHQEGNYYADKNELEKMKQEGQIAFKYAKGTNPNGSCMDIAGVLDETKKILGMMPHPENFVEDIQGGNDGQKLLMGAIAA